MYEVKRILGKRLEDSGLGYQVRWKGYVKSYDTTNSLGDYKADVAEYETSEEGKHPK